MNLVAGQVEKILLDTGLVYIDGQLIAPCEGDNAFSVSREYRDIPYNGMAGPTKGLKRVTRETATMTIHPKGLTQDMLAYALPGVTNTSDVLTGGGRQVIEDSEYHTVMLIGNTKDGLTKVITINNALANNGLTVTMSEDSESVLELVFEAHYDPTDLTAPIYQIEEDVASLTSTVTFTITGGAGASTVKFAGRTVSEDAGTAVFAGIVYGENRAYEVHEDGYASVYSSVTVDATTEAVSVTMVAN
jgi:hypothetical protein